MRENNKSTAETGEVNAPRVTMRDSLDAAISRARGGMRNSLIALKRGIEERKQWSPERQKASSIEIKLGEAIKHERWEEILNLSVELKSLAWETYHDRRYQAAQAKSDNEDAAIAKAEGRAQ